KFLIFIKLLPLKHAIQFILKQYEITYILTQKNSMCKIMEKDMQIKKAVD
ncbi:hypothetical protein Q604_UNBC06706G0001, partial [human gut metagenome]